MTATITSKGQITIPKSIRNSLGATYGDTVDFLIVNGEIIVRRAENMVDVEALNGILPSGKHASDSEIKKAKAIILSRKWKKK
jgi:AbrB family looped-hinge helix DNA binding protein